MEDFPAAHSMDTTWFAVDRRGQVALFWSSENGHVPSHAPNQGQVETHFARRAEDDPEDSWFDRDYATHMGIFYYAYDDGYNLLSPYRLVSIPEKPLHIDELPPAVRALCNVVSFPVADFCTQEYLQPVEFMPCSYYNAPDVYIASDNLTLRPLPGHEDVFEEVVREFFAMAPDYAKRFVVLRPTDV